ncbi:uncharacterized protein LOC103828475 [Brassica rapa]|uniref:uncharacterized protein LOC106446139 n=1 Tax=Brassica napus TaxID=3708 RepID=UPI0006AAF418|nr:uncharacterized protein LOC106446139 [Brassica napus]XP_033145715.1 uncharacterized protein LOC103828475 [Brassica rapa]
MAETREIVLPLTIPLHHPRSNFPQFTVTKQLHLQAWNPLACLPSPPAGCSVCWWSLYLWKDWMGICNENGTRHTRTVKDEEDSLKRKVKETMEKAFWDSVMESMKLEEPGMSFARWCLIAGKWK